MMRIASRLSWEYSVSDQPPTEARYTDGRMFQPSVAIVSYWDGELNFVQIHGYKLKVNGVPFKREDCQVTYRAEEVNSSDTPDWVRELVEDVRANPLGS